MESAEQRRKGFRKHDIAKLAEEGDRFSILEHLLPRVPLGTIWFSDTAKVGPANAEKCQVPLKVWEEAMRTRKRNNRCKGMFLSSFGRNHSSRHCEKATATDTDLCSTCLRMWTAAKVSESQCVSVKGRSEYEIITKALFSRPGVIENMRYWDKSSKAFREGKKLEQDYPYFSASEMVEMLLLDSMVVFKGGGRSGRTYARSAIIVEAQDEFVRVCMKCILVILRFERKQNFVKRWKSLVKTACNIHEQMLSNAQAKDEQVGAIQAADVIREELARSAEQSAWEHHSAKHMSIRAKRLGDWASAKKRTDACSSSESVSSTSPTMVPKSKPSSNSQPLNFKPVRKEAVKKQSQEKSNSRYDRDDDQVLEPKHKRFVIKQSGISGAGKGLFLTESAKHNEQIFRYSGRVINKKQAMDSDSAYIVKISDDVYLDGQGNDEWEGKMANCARKAGKKPNARISAATRYNICDKTSKCWVPLFAIGDLQPQEILVDYGDAYWSNEEGVSPLQSPESADGKSDVTDNRASDSDYVPQNINSCVHTGPPRVSERIAKENNKSNDSRKFETPKQQEPRRNEQDEQEGNNERHNDHQSRVDSFSLSSEVYAVGVGRCVGIFKSATRVYSVTHRFPGKTVRRFGTTVEAERYLKRAGINTPIRYWQSKYASGTLTLAPRSVIGTKVCFPAGLDASYYATRGWGKVESTFMDVDTRVWVVCLPNGFRDTMTEWPLLCGIQQYKIAFNGQAEEIYAIRGTDNNDGILTDKAMIASRLVGVNAEVQQFSTESEARQWIKEVKRKFYAVRGGSQDGVTTDSAEIPRRMTSALTEFEEFDSKESAMAWVRDSQFFTVKDSRGESRVMQLQEFLHKAKGQKGWTVVGPNPKARAVEILHEWMSASTVVHNNNVTTMTEKNHQSNYKKMVCIARMSDGSECGRSHKVKMTVVGPLCGEHVSLVSNSSPYERPRPEDDCSKRQVNESEKSATKLVSPEAGIMMPDKKQTIRRSKQGKTSVVAVRTFSDENYLGEEAGSIWISIDEAEEANLKRGEIKCFSRHADIFENIAEAREWISSQEGVSVEEDDIEVEFDRRMREARENRRKLNEASNPSRSGTSSRTRSGGNHDGREHGRNRGTSGRGRGRGKGRGRGRGRGKGRGARRKSSNARNSKTWDRNAKANRWEEQEHGDFDYDEDEFEEDEYAEEEEHQKGARGARFRRRQRNRGRGKDRRGGLRSSASVLLDKEQSRVEKQLFHEDAETVFIYEFDVPEMHKCVKIPLPGQPGALTTNKDAKHVISFGNNMEAVLAEKTFKSFKAFSLSELMEFQQLVQYVAEYQPEENEDITDSVVEGVNVIASNSIQTYSSMRDADSLGPHGQNFKAYTYLQVMYMVMFREVFEGSLAEMFFWDYAKKFAVKARGAAGMGPSKCTKVSESEPAVGASERCLFCGKAGHRASSNIHKHELAEGGGCYSQENLRKALATIANDVKLNAELKKRWSTRIKAFWAKMQDGTEDVESSSH